MAEFGGDDEDMDGMSFHDRLDFWGLEVPPNKQVDVVFGEDDEELIHLTQARSARRTSLTGALAERTRRRCGARSAAGAEPAQLCGCCVVCPLAAAAFRQPRRKGQSARPRECDRRAVCRSYGADALRCSAAFQVALGDKPGDEPAAVSLVVKGKTTFIGTLRKAKCDQFSVRARAGGRRRRHGGCAPCAC